MRKHAGTPLTEPKPSSNLNPLDDYLSLRQLARKLERSPTTVSRLVSELDLPFAVFLGRKHYSYPDLEERLRERKQTLAEVRRKKAKAVRWDEVKFRQ
jgi:hypothetical protein